MVHSCFPFLLHFCCFLFHCRSFLFHLCSFLFHFRSIDVPRARVPGPGPRLSLTLPHPIKTAAQGPGPRPWEYKWNGQGIERIVNRQKDTALWPSWLKQRLSPVAPPLEFCPSQMAADGEVEVPEHVQEFFSRYPVDDRAQAYLLGSSPAVQDLAVKDFRPKVEGESDYSGLLTSYVKRLRMDANAAGQYGGFVGSGKGGGKAGSAAWQISVWSDPNILLINIVGV
jgi:hypothetical protein